MRDAIPAQIKLEITLSYLATGMNYRSLQHFFRVSKSAISRLIPEVCDAICDKLKEHIKVPSTNEEWTTLERGFYQKWNFPKCYGALDGKHIEIRAPSNSGSTFFNYKKSNSIVLMALVDYDYCFTYIDVGANGSASDGAVFRNCSLFEKLENNLLPQGGVIVGDDAFPLKQLSRCRRIVENAFGILVSRFRIFEKPIACNINTVDKIVYTTCTLHNWLRHNSTSTYLPHGSCDIEDTKTGEVITGTWRSQITTLKSVRNLGTNYYSRQAKAIRNDFKSYTKAVYIHVLNNFF
ncbi:hypothetical protein NQ317_018505 [Molorchus minor]|uniref:DDE Tnp4 domain-containing protein n=1 Tax=Molorchus minor TaxID=1323400 RepID=A0ABQ9J9A8_9CUCU|nr:hypothetical protein NQ317_018505 [Molorchus minor]